MKPKKLYHKKYGWLTIKEQRYSPIGNRIVTIAVDSKGIEHELDGTEISEEEYFAEEEMLKREQEKTKKNQGFDENLREVFSHMKLVKGAKGDAGKDGYTPKAGIDYYTKAQVDSIIKTAQDRTLKGTIQNLIEDIRPIKGKDYFDGKDGYTPEYGKDYFTKSDVERFMAEVSQRVQRKVKNGIDGRDGKQGKSVEFKWEGTKLYIKRDGESWGEGKELKGLDGLNGGGGGGIHKIQDATDVSYSNPTEGQALVWSTTLKKWIPGEAVGGGAVESVNGQTGVVELDYEDVGAEPTKGEDDNYVTDAEKIVIGNTSGANTGDETQTTIKTKLGAATASVDGYATSTQITKLDGIEAGADVTDATNVAGAGAVMDGDFTSNGLLKRTAEGVYGIATSADYVNGFADPNADKIVFWDDSASAYAGLTPSTGLTLSGTNLTVRTASENQTGIAEQATLVEAIVGYDSSRFVTPQGLSHFYVSQKDQSCNIHIYPSVSSNNLVVELKPAWLVANFSTANRGHAIFHGDSNVKTISSAFSRTFNAGTNYLNLGSAELATKEVDLFVKLVYNTNTSAIDLILTRIPYGDYISDYVDSLTDEKGYMYSGTKPASTDSVISLGRFAATLSAGAGYTWSVPTFTATNLVNRPIYETRWLTYQPAYSASGSMTYGSVTTELAQYKVIGDKITLKVSHIGTTGGSASYGLRSSVPFAFTANHIRGGATLFTGSATVAGCITDSSALMETNRFDGSNWGIGANMRVGYQAIYEI
jgi:hypothetical protein